MLRKVDNYLEEEEEVDRSKDLVHASRNLAQEEEGNEELEGKEVGRKEVRRNEEGSREEEVHREEGEVDSREEHDQIHLSNC